MKEEKISLLIKIVYFFVFLLLVNHAQAVENSRKPEKIGISRSVKIAVENNHEYKIAALKEKEAKEKVNRAWGQLMPALESEISGSRQYAESGFMSLNDGQYDIRFIQLRFGVNPGVFYNSLKLSREACKSSRVDLRRVRASIEYSVIKSYFNLLLAGEIVKLRKDSLEVLKTNLGDVKNMFKAGTVAKFEVLQAEVKQGNQEVLLLEAESNYRTALDIFNFTLGRNRIEFTPDDSVLNRKSFVRPGNGKQKTERLINAALKNRPELLQLELKRKMLKNSEQINSSVYLWPTFTIAGSYGMTRYMPNTIETGVPPALGLDFSNITGTSDWQKTWQVRAAATYRWGALIPADPARAAEREEALKIREAEEEFLSLKRLIGITIRSSFSKLITSCLTIGSQKRNVETAVEGLRIARESYRAGIIKNSELLSSELTLTDARRGYINAIYSYYVALAELKKEIGVDDEKIILGGP